MPKKTSRMSKDYGLLTAGIRKAFTKPELLTLLKAAYITLSDGTTFDELADGIDIRDSDMLELRDKLDDFMGRP